MPEPIVIGDRRVGGGEPVLIIAEAGSNHDGRYEQALRLIDVAAEAGADAVKFQTFTAQRMYPRSAGASDYLQTAEPIYNLIERLEMPREWVPELAAHCRSRRILFLSTPFDEASADWLSPHVGAFKVASYEMTHDPLVRHLARFGKPMIVSTGAAALDEVIRAVQLMREEGNEQVILCQCTACYPAPPEAMNLRALVTLRQATGCPVGLSDHSRDPLLAPVVAVALGACVIEKHFTLSNALSGPDHRFAVEPQELAQMVRGVRLAEQMLGHGRKELLPQEQELHAFARRTIFSTRPIRAGERLDEGSIAVLRCGKLGRGLAPAEYGRLIGRLAACDIPAEHPLQAADVR